MFFLEAVICISLRLLLGVGVFFVVSVTRCILSDTLKPNAASPNARTTRATHIWKQTGAAPYTRPLQPSDTDLNSRNKTRPQTLHLRVTTSCNKRCICKLLKPTSYGLQYRSRYRDWGPFSTTEESWLDSRAWTCPGRLRRPPSFLLNRHRRLLPRG
jgi:hypothetical protein